MEKEPFTLKDPKTVLEIDGVRYGAGQLTPEKVRELIARDSAYSQYFNFPQTGKPKKKSRNEKSKKS